MHEIAHRTYQGIVGVPKRMCSESLMEQLSAPYHASQCCCNNVNGLTPGLWGYLWPSMHGYTG